MSVTAIRDIEVIAFQGKGKNRERDPCYPSSDQQQQPKLQQQRKLDGAAATELKTSAMIPDMLRRCAGSPCKTRESGTEVP
jgi:hypothetical protein